MIKKSRILQLLAVLFAFTLITAACGDDDDSGSSSASESSESAVSYTHLTLPTKRIV